MKRVFQTLKSKWPEYMLEVFVIIIGILGAYGLNNWNEYENNRSKEYELLSELKTEITINCRRQIPMIMIVQLWH